jgi:hypothetical protein
MPSMPSASTSINRRPLAQWHEILAPYNIGYRIKGLPKNNSVRSERTAKAAYDVARDHSR